jgi:hypothetical protein
MLMDHLSGEMFMLSSQCHHVLNLLEVSVMRRDYDSIDGTILGLVKRIEGIQTLVAKGRKARLEYVRLVDTAQHAFDSRYHPHFAPESAGDEIAWIDFEADLSLILPI